jgi:hypothetical protein
MPTDLLTRARNAVTRDEECAVIRAAVCHFITDAAQRLPLTDIIVDVRSGRAPAAVLPGVVAALARGLWTVSSEDGDAHARYMPAGHDGSFVGGEYREADAFTAALALLIAIMEAGNAEA